MPTGRAGAGRGRSSTTRADGAGHEAGHPSATAPSSPRARTGGGEPLDRARLVEEAAALADEEGWSALTLSAVARRVSRHVTTLYAHVANLDELEREVALLAMRELSDRVWEAALGRSQREALDAIAGEYRRYAADHPGRAAAMVEIGRRPDEQVAEAGRRLAQPGYATLRSYGLDEAQVVHAYRVFSAALRGLGSFGPVPDAEATYDEMLDLLDTALRSGTWPSPH